MTRQNILTIGASLLFAAMLFGAARSCAETYSEHCAWEGQKKLQHKQQCKEARVAFFEDCLKYDPSPECQTMWVELHGHMFDSPPDKPWADEIDCSTETK